MQLAYRSRCIACAGLGRTEKPLSWLGARRRYKRFFRELRRILSRLTSRVGVLSPEFAVLTVLGPRTPWSLSLTSLELRDNRMPRGWRFSQRRLQCADDHDSIHTRAMNPFRPVL